MAIQGNLKKQLDSILSRVKGAEKIAEKQIRSALKSTEQLRVRQLKGVQKLMRRARSLRDSDVAKKADMVKKEIESRAAEGLDSVLAKLKVPTSKDMERLNKRISTLQKRLDQVEKSVRTKS